MSLYEDRTFENLQAEALEDLNEKMAELPENQRVDASEGSFIYTAISKVARWLEEAYSDLDALNDNMLVDTQDFDHLVDSGAECGVPLIEGTPAVVIAYLNCQCEIGDVFSAVDSDYDYIAVLYIGSEEIEGETVYKYRLEADEEGLDPGNYRGDIEPEDYLEGFESGTIVSTYKAGTEDEDEDEYRERRIQAFESQACAGNYDYYKETVGNISGVGGVKVVRRVTGQHHIDCYVQAADYGVPTSGLLDTVKETMDPSDHEGEGVGLCPFGHVLHVYGVTSTTINVTADFTYEDGYSIENTRTAMQTAAGQYVTSLASSWQDSDSLLVRRARVEAKLIEVTGIADVQNLRLNGTDSNITLESTVVPVMGTVAEEQHG